MSRLTRDGTAEPVSRDQIIRHVRGHGNIDFSCPADHEQDWQPYPVDPYPAMCDDHTYIHTYIHTPRLEEWIINANSARGPILQYVLQFSLRVCDTDILLYSKTLYLNNFVF